MKRMTCKQLRGACDASITGDSPEEMGENCQEHVMEMLEAEDEAHMEAVASMQKLSAAQQHQWFEQFKIKFAELPDVE